MGTNKLKVDKLEAGKFYMHVSRNDVKYILLLDKPIPAGDTYKVSAFIIMIHKSVDNVYIYSLDGENHKFHLRDTDVIFSMKKEDFERVISKIFETKTLEWSD